MAETPRTVLVTGATDGLGRALAGTLACEGLRVLVHGRDPDRVAAAVEGVAAHGGPEPAGYVADFAALAEVRRLAAEVRREQSRLDVLVNNAGIGPGPAGAQHRETSADGHELRLQVNHLAAHLLTRELLPLLRASAPARVVHVASGAQRPVDLDDPMLERDYDGDRAYAQSKLAMVADALALAEALDPAEVTVNALHPGSLMDTKIVRESFGRAQRPIDEGVAATARLVLDDDLAGVTGRFFNGTVEAAPAPEARDPEARAAVLALTAELTGT